MELIFILKKWMAGGLSEVSLLHDKFGSCFIPREQSNNRNIIILISSDEALHRANNRSSII
jgi:hypothetical protein